MIQIVYIVCLQVEVLQEEIVYATEEVERLTKVLDEQNSLLQASQEQTAKKDVIIQNLQQKVKFFYFILFIYSIKSNNTSMLPISPISTFYQLQRQHEAVEKTIRNGAFQPPVEPTVTPKSFPRVKPAYVFKYEVFNIYLVTGAQI